MFGYVKYDLPYLCVKDLMLYKALYCGLCKGIGKSCGGICRVGLSYDVTFLSALLHNMRGERIEIEKQNCFEHAIRKRPIAKVDALTRELGALNTALVFEKLSDDIRDDHRGRGKRFLLKRGMKRAKREYPKLFEIIKTYSIEQDRAEKGEVSCDRAAEPSARMMQALSRHFLGGKASESSDELFYALGKWVYLIDALDDFEKDKKKESFNPFVLCYAAEDKKSLIENNREEISFLFDTLFFSMREGLKGIEFSFDRDLTDNVILRGIPLETNRVLKGEPPSKMKLLI